MTQAAKVFAASVCLWFVSALLLSSPANAGNHGCDCCGCQKHVKKVCRLVTVCKPVDYPEYHCEHAEVFCPHKGKVCHKMYRCEKIYKLKKTCCCKTTCDGCCHKQHCDCVTTCTCETKSGCQTHYGAKPTGCFSCATVVKPKPRRITVPIVKWVSVCVCKKCHYALRRGEPEVQAMLVKFAGRQ